MNMNATATYSLLAALWWVATSNGVQAQPIGRLDVLGPSTEAGTYLAGVSVPGRGLVPPPEGYGPFPLVLARSLPVAGATPDQGCSTYENTDEVAGKIVLVRDGVCSFYYKYSHAEAADVAGIVVFASDPVSPDDDTTLRSIIWAQDALVDLYGLYITRFRGERLRTALLSGETVTVTLRSEPATAGEPEPDVESLDLAAGPNPVRGAVTLRLTVARPQAVRVEVFNALGRRVALVHDGPLGSGGHELPADLRALPAGVYVVRAVGGSGVVVRTLVRAP